MALPPSLRFDRAIYGSRTSHGAGNCAFCGRGLGDTRFEVLQQPACEVCGQRALAHFPPDSRAAFLRSLGAGFVTALAGGLLLMLLLSTLPTSSSRGWTSYLGGMALGWVIGKLMRLASGGMGGRRYQIAAALLTYAAVIYPLQISLLGAHQEALWMYALVPLRPFLFLLTGFAQVGVWQLLAAFLGIRFAWMLLKPAPQFVRQLSA